MFSIDGVVQDGAADQTTLLVHPPMAEDEGPQAYRLRLCTLNRVSARELDAIGFSVSTAIRQGASARKVHGSEPTNKESALIHIFDQNSGDVVRSTRRVCPLCLTENSHAKFAWELRFVEACARHGVWLVDRCDACQKQLSWDSGTPEQCACGKSLSSSSAASAPEAVVFLAQLIESKVSGRRLEAGVWQDLTLQETQRVARFLGNFVARSNVPKPQKITNLDQLTVSWPMTSAAAEIMHRWPAAFNEFLRAQVQQFAGTRDSGKLSGTFRGFYRVLYAQFATGPSAFIRQSFEAYVSNHWTGALGKRNRRLDPEAVRAAKWVPMNRARKNLGVTQRQLVDMIERERFSVSARQTAAGRTFAVIAKADASEALAQDARYEDLRTAAKRLGITRRRAAIVLPLMEPSLRRVGNSPCVWCIPTTIVTNVLQRVEASRGCDSSPPSGILIGDILRFSKWPDTRVATLFSKIKNGEIVVLGRCEKRNGICGAFISGAAMRELASLESSRSAFITIPELAEDLAIKQEVAYHLVNKGLINASALPSSCGGRQIARSAVAEFRSNYSFARDIARGRKTSTRKLLRDLVRVGTRPICSPQVDGCRQVIFRRDDILPAERT
jgi:TniQ